MTTKMNRGMHFRPRSTLPLTPTTGDFCFHGGALKAWNGTDWKEVSASPPAPAYSFTLGTPIDFGGFYQISVTGSGFPPDTWYYIFFGGNADRLTNSSGEFTATFYSASATGNTAYVWDNESDRLARNFGTAVATASN